MFSTRRSVSASYPSPATASKSAPSASRARASHHSGKDLRNAAASSLQHVQACFRASSSSSTTFVPGIFFLCPSRMTLAETAKMKVLTSPGRAPKSPCFSKKAFTALTIWQSSFVATSPSSWLLGDSPAAIRTASSLEVFEGSNAKSDLTTSGSSAGCSRSPAFTSSASASFATFCMPPPMEPDLHFSMAAPSSAMMVFCIFGEPPDVFQTLLATRLTAASGSLRATNAKIKTRSLVSLFEHSSQVRRS
mmetsp:Transcript_19889/g.46561  ORF Transcript_19889/g.46561 Transcript_19889/m.46561 type:complete len:249 (-) Transcript_19889:1698-2444(-)